jgi:predicted adenylyl cyclase CyaB
MKEIEVRFRVTQREYNDILDILKQHNEVSESIQKDTYYCGKIYMDTNTTKDCPYVVRVRESNKKNSLTYKSFVEGGTTWIEEETEISNINSTNKILNHLGLVEYLSIDKHRITAKCISSNGEKIEVNLDKIDKLGDFIELEIIHDDTNFGKSELQRFISEDLHCKGAKVVDKGYVQLMEEYLADNQ